MTQSRVTDIVKYFAGKTIEQMVKQGIGLYQATSAFKQLYVLEAIKQEGSKSAAARLIKANRNTVARIEDPQVAEREKIYRESRAI